jgi:hypothetical protein
MALTRGPWNRPSCRNQRYIGHVYRLLTRAAQQRVREFIAGAGVEALREMKRISIEN